MNCYNCQKIVSLKKTFIKSPTKEPKYIKKNYLRKLFKCKFCNHYMNISNIDFKKIYKDSYSNISYGQSINKKYNFLLSLKSKSDNFHRVKRIIKFLQFKKNKYKILDVGSGFGIFPIELSKIIKNLNIDVIEPDKNNIKFMKKFNLKIKSKFVENFSSKKSYDLITLNKVIEHIEDPLKILKKLKKNMIKKSYIYIEVPDGESASKDKEGLFREEFFVDHHHIFSKKSLKNLLSKCGFKTLIIKKIVEPSNKYTLYAFAKLNI